MNFTRKEQIRIDIVAKYIEGDICPVDAIQILEISERQFRRLVKAFRESGVEGLRHGNKGRSPANKISEFTRNKVCLLYRERYYDLSVRHFIEKLMEVEQFEQLPSYTTVRKMLLQERLIQRTNKKARKVYRRRNRCEKEGIMVQIDGSHHHWIGGHAPFCLTAAIDDATGEIVGAHFSKTETTFAAMTTVEQVLKSKGRFNMLYSDKAGIYGGGKRQYYSQMDRAMKEFDIHCVQANSPQAKGRVERLFGTLQGRLVQELRLAGVKTIEDANRFLKAYIGEFNKRFARKSISSESAYKKLEHSLEEVNEILTLREYRKVQSGNIVNFESDSLIIESHEYLTKKTVEIRFYRDGQRKFFIDESEIRVTKLLETDKAA